MIASEASCPTPGASRSRLGQEAPGSWGKTPWVKGEGSHNKHFEIENLEFHSKLNYILYIIAVTKTRNSGNSGLDSDSGVRENIRPCLGFGCE